MVKTGFETEMKWFVDYYGFDLNKHMTKVWFKLLEKYTVGQLHMALEKHIETSDQPYFPALGKIITIIKTVKDTFVEWSPEREAAIPEAEKDATMKKMENFAKIAAINGPAYFRDFAKRKAEERAEEEI